MLTLPLVCLALAASTAVDPSTIVQGQVTGIWKGRATGEGELIPANGLPVTLWLRATDAALRGQFRLQGFDVLETNATFDEASSSLVLESALNGVPFVVRATVTGDRLEGTLSGKGLELKLVATRTAEDVLAQPPAPSAPVDLAQLDSEAWAADLEFLTAYLPQVHMNAYHSLTRTEWQGAAAELAGRIPEMSGVDVALALARLVARVGDAHTGLAWNEVPGFDPFPVHFELFADGLFITAIDERWGDALGLRVVGFGSRSSADALAAVSSLFASENESWRRARAPRMLKIPLLLAKSGMLESSELLSITVESWPGEEFVLEVGESQGGPVLRAPDPEFDVLPLWRTRIRQNYWLQVFEDERAVYVAYNRCSEDPRAPMFGFITEVLEAVEIIEAERLIIDLRNNPGGNSRVLSDQIKRMSEHPRLNQAGGILALIGPQTYSSGMMNAHQLRRDARAVLIGEATGGKPNSYGEVRSFRLPNSGLLVSYSTKYFRMLEEDPPSVEPDVLVELASEDHFSGTDRVLERALEFKPEEREH